MDIRTRIMICRLLTYTHQNPLYSERVGVKDISYFREDNQSAKKNLNATKSYESNKELELSIT